MTTVYVVDDDAAVGRAVASAGALLGHPVRAFESAEAFLAAVPPDAAGCLVLDVRMPGMTGLELQKRLADDGYTLSVVVLSGHADVRAAVEAMTLGAQTLLEKPFGLDELLSHVRKAVEKDAAARSARSGQRTRRPGWPGSPRRSGRCSTASPPGGRTGRSRPGWG